MRFSSVSAYEISKPICIGLSYDPDKGYSCTKDNNSILVNKYKSFIDT